MLWVGTNNHGHTAEQICGGIMAIVQVIKNKLPNAQTLVLVGFSLSLQCEFFKAFKDEFISKCNFVNVKTKTLSIVHI